MSSITVPIKLEEHPHVRALNVLRDLSKVADLIELCFSNTMDNDGQRYLSDMRRASRDDSFLSWANHMAETTSMPMTGYVWEQEGRIIGNVSLIPFREKGKRIYLIANVAVHPDHRGRGIAQILTRRGMDHAREKKTSAIWLHVRDDNPGAIHIYEKLGFEEIVRRTAWQAETDPFRSRNLESREIQNDIQIVPRQAEFWSLQQEWLRRLYPESVGWYHSWDFNALKPGLVNWLYLLFVDFNIKQWAAVHGNELLATLAWMPQGGRSETLYAATGTESARSEDERAQALTKLLLQARRTLPHPSTLTLDFPAGEMTEAIAAAGFKSRRTLLWMRS